MARVRVRQHVNPLSQKYQTPIAPPEWEKVYTQIDRPLQLDIGCGRGRFLLSMATMQPHWNFLGLEIREPLVEEANLLRDEAGLKNLHYLFCNVGNALNLLLASLPTGILQRVSIQFPDPWFKKRHYKRRMIQPETVETLAAYLIDGGEVFIQSDVQEVEMEICSRFDIHPAFQKTHSSWLENNPLPVQTEREISTLSRGEPVYRALFKKLETNADKPSLAPASD